MNLSVGFVAALVFSLAFVVKTLRALSIGNEYVYAFWDGGYFRAGKSVGRLGVIILLIEWLTFFALIIGLWSTWISVRLGTLIILGVAIPSWVLSRPQKRPSVQGITREGGQKTTSDSPRPSAEAGHEPLNPPPLENPKPAVSAPGCLCLVAIILGGAAALAVGSAIMGPGTTIPSADPELRRAQEIADAPVPGTNTLPRKMIAGIVEAVPMMGISIVAAALAPEVAYLWLTATASGWQATHAPTHARNP